MQLADDDDLQTKSGGGAVILHGQWSPIRRQRRDENREEFDERSTTKNALENNQVLKQLPNKLLPVHRHLRRTLEKEREQAESRDQEREPPPRPSLQSERNFHKTALSVSLGNVDESEGL